MASYQCDKRTWGGERESMRGTGGMELRSEEGEALVLDAPIHEQLPSRLEAEVALQVEYGDPRL